MADQPALFDLPQADFVAGRLGRAEVVLDGGNSALRDAAGVRFKAQGQG